MAQSDYSLINGQTHHSYPMPEPEYYIYFYHTGTYIVLPTYPETITDTVSSTYSSTTPLGRSAPIQSYSGSGPRTLQFSFTLHRDEMWQLNYNNSSIDKASLEKDGDDYVDLMAKRIQGAVLPEYSATDKMVNPPMIAVNIGKEVFIKGVVTSAGVVYQPPVLTNGHYANIQITFTVVEVVPYSASIAMNVGSYRNLDYTLGTNGVYSAKNNGESATGNKVTTNSSGSNNDGTPGG